MATLTKRDREILRNIQAGRNWRATKSPLDGTFEVPTTARGPKSQAIDRLVRGGYVTRDPMRRPALQLTALGEQAANGESPAAGRPRRTKYET